MSRIITNATATRTIWSQQTPIFLALIQLNPNLALRGDPNQPIRFGASSASALLGPDLMMPGQQANNPPTVRDYPWSNSPPIFQGGPNLPFDQAHQVWVPNVMRFIGPWVRGHLINGRWGGSGNTWRNLTPLTQQANQFHSPIEQHMDNYLTNSLRYEDAAHRNHWYGIWYKVQCSVAPFSQSLAQIPARNNLYSYAPAFIKITWRAVSIQKPVGQNSLTVRANPLMAGQPLGVPNLPFQFALPPLPVVQPPGNIRGGNIYPAPAIAGVTVGFPVEANNGFDGEIEIHQV